MSRIALGWGLACALLVAPGSLRAEARANETAIAVDLDDGRSVVIDVVPGSAGPPPRIEVVESGGRVRLFEASSGDRRTGRVRGEPESFASVRRAGSGWRGFLRMSGATYGIEPGGSGTVGRAVGTGVDVPEVSSLGCGTRELGPPPAPDPRSLVASLGVATPAGPRNVQLAIDTDRELWGVWQADEPTVDFVVSLVGAASAVYERELGLRLQLTYLRLWQEPTAPWERQCEDSSNCYNEELLALRKAWADEVSRHTPEPDAVYLLRGRRKYSDNIAGAAWPGAICDRSSGYGLVRTFAATNPFSVLATFVHELGHTFGSGHTHCYQPPLDRCSNDCGGAPMGPVVPSVGTVMSYCHLHPAFGRLVTFPSEVRGVILRTLAAGPAACVRPVCDDYATDRAVCDDGDPCTNDACDPDTGCTATPVPGCCARDADCDDANVCTEDRCDAGGRCVAVPVADGVSCSDGDPCAGGEERCRGGACAPQLVVGYAAAGCAMAALRRRVSVLADSRVAARLRRRADALDADLAVATAARLDGAQRDEQRARRHLERSAGRMIRALRRARGALSGDVARGLAAMVREVRGALRDAGPPA